jgi:hypothetical protein
VNPSRFDNQANVYEVILVASSQGKEQNMSHVSILRKLGLRIVVACLVLGTPSAVWAYGNAMTTAQEGDGFSGDASFAALKATLIEMLGTLDLEGCTQVAASAVGELPT